MPSQNIDYFVHLSITCLRRRKPKDETRDDSVAEQARDVTCHPEFALDWNPDIHKERDAFCFLVVTMLPIVGLSLLLLNMRIPIALPASASMSETILAL